MANLRQVFVAQEQLERFVIQRGVAICEDAKVLQFIIVDISPVLLGEEIGINSISSALRENDAPVHVLVQTFLEDATAEIVSLAIHDLADRVTKLAVRNASLARRFGEPGCLERPDGYNLVYHKKIALSATKCKAA
jgi:hypothetical protein